MAVCPTTLSHTLGHSLTLNLINATIELKEGIEQVKTTAQLIFYGDDSPTPIKSEPYQFIAPIGLIELQDIQWYIQSYYRWPSGVFKTRANKLEQDLVVWGKLLYQCVFESNLLDGDGQSLIKSWLQQSGTHRLFIDVSQIEQNNGANTNRAICRLLAIPWEILHNGNDFLIAAFNLQISRCCFTQRLKMTSSTALPVRILLFNPRPVVNRQGDQLTYFDHRSCALPLLAAMEDLGPSLVKVDIAFPPTFAQLKHLLRQAKSQGQAYQVVHFDGHGIYDANEDCGVLCFESPQDEKIVDYVYADEFAQALQDADVSLVYLDACQSAISLDDPSASLSAQLLRHGVRAVVAMSHTVLVETAEVFVKAFYQHLVLGQPIGDAMLIAQQTLFNNSHRGQVVGAGKLTLRDWFVPVLYQNGDDMALLTSCKTIDTQPCQLKLGHLPKSPPHNFVGRSSDLLKLERLLHKQQTVLIRAGGGMGKTALAVELARWLVRCGRFEQVVFVSVASYSVDNIEAIIDIIGRQLIVNYSVATYGDDTNAALRPIAQILIVEPTLIVFDNMESVLPTDYEVSAADDVQALIHLLQSLLSFTTATRIIFTSRELLPEALFEPIVDQQSSLNLGPLVSLEAIELVEKVMTLSELQSPMNDNVKNLQQITDLVELVNGHPRALVLLAKELVRGVITTSETLTAILAKLEQQNPQDRENSLYASLALSISRLPCEIVIKIPAFAVFHGGGHLEVLAQVMAVDQNEILKIVQTLADLGIVQIMPYQHIRCDPALVPYAKRIISPQQRATYTTRWADSIEQLVNHLFDQIFDDSETAFQSTLLELPNLLAFIDWVELQIHSQNESSNTDFIARISEAVRCIEQLFARIGQPKALAKAVMVREKLTTTFNKWDHDLFENERMKIERLQQQGKFESAIAQARLLIAQAIKAGIQDYECADYDFAMAHELLGDLLRLNGQVTNAIELLGQAESLFDQAAERGQRMACACVMKQANCLFTLGQLDNAATRYQDCIVKFEKLGDIRSCERSICSSVTKTTALCISY